MLSADNSIAMLIGPFIDEYVQEYPVMAGLVSTYSAVEDDVFNHRMSFYYGYTTLAAFSRLLAEKEEKVLYDIRFLVFSLSVHLWRFFQLVNRKNFILESEPPIADDEKIKTHGMIQEILSIIEKTEYEPDVLNYPISVKMLISSSLIILGNEDFKNRLNAEYEKRAMYSIEKQKNNFRNSGVCQYCGGEFKGLIKKICSKCRRPKDY